MIVALGCGFALAGSPQLHERVHHSTRATSSSLRNHHAQR
jgi:hypothetical protein